VECRKSCHGDAPRISSSRSLTKTHRLFTEGSFGVKPEAPFLLTCLWFITMSPSPMLRTIRLFGRPCGGEPIVATVMLQAVGKVACLCSISARAVVLAAFFAILWFAAPFRAESATQAVTVNTTNRLTTPFLPSALSDTQVGNSPAWKDREKVLGFTTFTEGLEVLTPAAAVDLDFNTARTKRITLAQDTVLTCVNIPTASTNIETMLVEVIGDGIYTVIFTNAVFQTPTINTPPAGVVTFYGLRADDGNVRGYCDPFGSSASGYIIGPLTPTYIPVASSTTNVTDSIMSQNTSTSILVAGGVGVGASVATTWGGLGTTESLVTFRDASLGDNPINQVVIGSSVDSTIADAGIIYQIAMTNSTQGIWNTSSNNVQSGWNLNADLLVGGPDVGFLGKVLGATVVDIRPTAVDGVTPYFFDTSVAHTTGNIIEAANANTLEFVVAAGSGYTGAGTKFLSDDGTYKSSTFTNVADEVWINQAGVVSLVPGNTNYVVSILSQSPDNATNVVLVVDTDTTWTNSAALISGRMSGDEVVRIGNFGSLTLGKDSLGNANQEHVFYASRAVNRGEQSIARIYAESVDDDATYAEYSSFGVDVSTNLAVMNMIWQGTSEDSIILMSVYEDALQIQGNYNGTTMFELIPTSPDGTRAYEFDTYFPHTTGNLVEVANNGTNKFTIAALSGYTGAGTLFLSDDGTYKSASGGSALWAMSGSDLIPSPTVSAALITNNAAATLSFKVSNATNTATMGVTGGQAYFQGGNAGDSLQPTFGFGSGDGYYHASNTHLWTEDTVQIMRLIYNNAPFNGAGAISLGAGAIYFGSSPLNFTNSISSGQGTPEGVLTQPSGSFYIDRTVGAAKAYLKESGTGNTGWVQLGTGSGSVSGTGTTDTIPLWTGASTQGNSIATQSGTTNITVAGSLGIGAVTNLLRVFDGNLTYTNAATTFSFQVKNSSGGASVESASGSANFRSVGSGSVPGLVNNNSAGLKVYTDSVIGPTSDNAIDLAGGLTSTQFRDIGLRRNVVWNAATNSLIDSWSVATPENSTVARGASLIRDTVGGFLYLKAAGTAATNWNPVHSGNEFYLASDQTTTSATLATTTLSANVFAGKKYGFTCVLYISDSVAAEGAQIDFNGGTATATNFRVHVTAFDSALSLSSQGTSLATAYAVSTFTGSGMFECHGSIEPSASGSLIPRYAQNTHAVGTLTLARGSHLIVWDIP